MKVIWLGQNGLLFVSGKNKILIDPYLTDTLHELDVRMERGWIINKRFLEISPDIIILTNSHLDHLDIPTLRTYIEKNRDQRTLLCCESAFEVIADTGIIGRYNNVLFDEDYEWTHDNLHIKAVRAYSDDKTAIGVIITDTTENKKYYVTSDTLYNEKIFSKLPDDIDTVFLPINGEDGCMNMHDACRFADRVKAVHTVPVHFGMFDDINPKKFKYEGAVIPMVYKIIPLEDDEDAKQRRLSLKKVFANEEKTMKMGQIRKDVKTEEPKSASVEVEPTPVEIKPAPVEVKPTPVEVKPAPVEVKPTPIEVKPAPVEVKPAPVEVKPAPVEVKPAPVEVKPTPVDYKPKAPEPIPAEETRSYNRAREISGKRSALWKEVAKLSNKNGAEYENDVEEPDSKEALWERLDRLANETYDDGLDEIPCQKFIEDEEELLSEKSCLWDEIARMSGAKNGEDTKSDTSVPRAEEKKEKEEEDFSVEIIEEDDSVSYDEVEKKEQFSEADIDESDFVVESHNTDDSALSREDIDKELIYYDDSIADGFSDDPLYDEEEEDVSDKIDAYIKELENFERGDTVDFNRADLK